MKLEADRLHHWGLVYPHKWTTITLEQLHLHREGEREIERVHEKFRVKQ